MRVGLLLLALAAALMSTAARAEIRVASWNLNNLHHRLDEPLRPGAPARTEADIEILRKYRDRADAGIFALQEVNGRGQLSWFFPPISGICSSPDATPTILSPVGKATGSTLALRSGAVCSTRSASEMSRT